MDDGSHHDEVRPFFRLSTTLGIMTKGLHPGFVDRQVFLEQVVGQTLTNVVGRPRNSHRLPSRQLADPSRLFAPAHPQLLDRQRASREPNGWSERAWKDRNGKMCGHAPRRLARLNQKVPRLPQGGHVEGIKLC